MEACPMETDDNLGGSNRTGKRKRVEDDIAGVRGSFDPLKYEKRHQRSESRKKRIKSNISVSRKHVQRIDIEQESEQLVPQDPESIARRYQLEVLEMAKKRNVIVFLETGLGKTLIAVLLMKYMASRLQDPLKKGIAVFLVPKVILADQQLAVIRCHTSFKAESYYGSKGVDAFDFKQWQEEMNRHEVMVMTPQVFLDALRSAKMKMELVQLLILDECHHARKKDAYAKIMEEYYHVSDHKPKVLGLTASPGQQGAKSRGTCDDSIKELEKILDAQVFTPKYRLGLELHVPTPDEKAAYYQQGQTGSLDTQIPSLAALRDKYAVLSIDETSDHTSKFQDEKEAAKRLKRHIGKLHGSIVHCIEELGYWCALKAVEKLLKEDLSPAAMEYLDAELLTDIKKKEKDFLQDALELLQSAVGTESLCKDLVTSKVQRLVEVLMTYRHTQDLRCIVFVERVIGTIGISELVNGLSQLGSLSFLRCAYLTGCNGSYMDATTRKQQEDVLRDFRSGKVNIVMATDVAEEGLDVQGCNAVVRFDLPKTVTSYIQSRGRARRPGSEYIFLLQEHVGLEVKIRKLKDDEKEMRSLALDRSEEAVQEPFVPSNTAFLESYHVETTGAIVNTDSSVSLVYRYCSKLPRDKFYSPRPDFRFSKTEDNQHVCILTLPSNALIHEIVSAPRESDALAKKVVCLKACEELHKLGGLSDHLLPVTDTDRDDEMPGSNSKTTQKRGITKQKELHGSIATKGLQGCWGNSKTAVLFYAYVIKFTPNSEEKFSDFVLLLESELDNNAAELVVRLTLKADQEMTASLSPASVVHLEADEVEDAKKFQEVLFNGMFSRLVARSQTASGLSSWTTNYLCSSTENMDKLWAHSKIYLLLPLVKRGGANLKALKDQKQSFIDWECVQRGAHVADALAKQSTRDFCVSPDSAEQIIGTAIVTRHTGRIYVVTKIQEDINAQSAFPVNKGQPEMTYEDYFRNKYGEQLRNPRDAFLQAKHSHRIRNMLIRSTQLVDTRNNGKECRHANLAPELCIPTGFRSSIIHTAYMIPSVMHHLDALLQAGQLQKEIRTIVPQCPRIPLIRIVEALTTSRCLEKFSLERLEMLGDSFLKYAVTRHLFLTFQNKHEGQLTARRIRAISNTTLYKLSVARNLPAYIRDEVFNPKRWLAPGMKSRFTETCQCDLAELKVSTGQNTSSEQTCEANTNRSFRKVGKSCIDGHRWLCLKTMADVVEALIGTYLIYGGEDAALSFMKWVGIDTQYEVRETQTLREQVLVKPEIMESVHLDSLERCLGYTFCNKALLVEALTHASQQDGMGGRCYQRLEFLGDAVLDFMVSKHLFTAYPDLPPGRLTDLRSAAVNNGCFARVAVKHNLQQYLRHESRALMSQIEHFVRTTADSVAQGGSFGWERDSGPKVLGDIVESIAGAIAIDTGFDLEKTSGILEKLLAPMVTPNTLPVHPVRELQELCQVHGFSLHIEEGRHPDGKLFTVTSKVTSGETTITETVCTTSRKAARKGVAQQLLKILQNYRNKGNPACVGALKDNMASMAADCGTSSVPCGTSNVRLQPSEVLGDSTMCQRHRELIMNLNQDLMMSRELDALVPLDVLLRTKVEEVTGAVEQDREVIEEGGIDTLAGSCLGVVDTAPAATIGPRFTPQGLKYVMSLNLPLSPPSNQEHVTRDMTRTAELQYLVKSAPEGQHGEDPADPWLLTAGESYQAEASKWTKRKIDFGVHITDSSVQTIKKLKFSTLADMKRSKAELYELCAKRKWSQPVFFVSNEAGPPHMKRFTSSVRVRLPGGETLVSEGTEMSDKKKAEHSAAFIILEKLKELPLAP